jgi:hypothetical protein
MNNKTIKKKAQEFPFMAGCGAQWSSMWLKKKKNFALIVLSSFLFEMENGAFFGFSEAFKCSKRYLICILD